jgi:hypothetical protein
VNPFPLSSLSSQNEVKLADFGISRHLCRLDQFPAKGSLGTQTYSLFAIGHWQYGAFLSKLSTQKHNQGVNTCHKNNPIKEEDNVGEELFQEGSALSLVCFEQ